MSRTEKGSRTPYRAWQARNLPSLRGQVEEARGAQDLEQGLEELRGDGPCQVCVELGRAGIDAPCSVCDAPHAEHAWVPVAGEAALYSCSCGAFGSRRRGGAILETSRRPERVATVQHVADDAVDATGAGRGTRVEPLPSLDETERR